MVFLLDNSLKGLPFEKLLVFNDIDAKSRDVSLFVLGKRYQYLNYNPELKTITGMQKDKLSYICYDFKNPEINFEVMLK